MRSIKQFKEIVTQSTEMFSFAFEKQDPVDILFPNGISKYLNSDEEKIKRIVASRLIEYFKEKFTNKKLPVLFHKYIASKNKEEIDITDFVLFDELLNSKGMDYELTFEDAAKISSYKKVEKFFKQDLSKDILEENNFIDKIYEFIEITNQENEEVNKEEKVIIDIDTTDAYKLYRNECVRYKLLTYEEERIYLKEYQETKDPLALDILVGSNQGLVQKVACNYLNRGLEYLDLIDEGNIGLMKAISDFDLNLNYKLSTYAMWWIRQAIKTALTNKARVIRVPFLVNEDLSKLKRIERELGNELGMEPNDDELVKRWNEKTKDDKKKIDISKLNDLKKTRNLVDNNIFLDKGVTDGSKDDSILADFVEDEEAVNPEDYAESMDIKRLINKAIDEVNIRSTEDSIIRARLIIRMRYGIFNDDVMFILEKNGLDKNPREMTLEEISKIFDITPERVRQIEAQVMKKLKIRIKVYENEKRYQKCLEKKNNH